MSDSQYRKGQRVRVTVEGTIASDMQPGLPYIEVLPSNGAAAWGVELDGSAEITVLAEPRLTKPRVSDGEKIPGALPRVTKSIDLGNESSSEFQVPSTSSEGTFLPKPLPSGEHNVVTSSLGIADKHAPVLDLDIPHELVPSATPGHSHLYLDVSMTWEQYKKLLKVLAEVGIIEHGYYRASVAKGFSAARLPWCPKVEEKEELPDVA